MLRPAQLYQNDFKTDSVQYQRGFTENGFEQSPCSATEGLEPAILLLRSSKMTILVLRSSKMTF